MTKSDPTTPAVEEPTEIVRDVSFTRFVADEAFFTSLGRDLEVGFIQYGPLYGVQTDHGDYEIVETKRVLTEVARMRISYPAMVNMMVNFLQSGIEEGRLKSDSIMKSLKTWMDNAENSKKEGE